ncbi:DedA family protein [Homoserinibacter sp. YIM 151385]|uniref:DedA family protein n=1 Tax=Homoserinibacter sp. YIM 151385 TaxID=2985506 RepID=UPI0022F11366|nr:VTT domain-containing protein [Homoserinibacter sp. YIM 151385]WBU38924.1 VTT domain-containing protein [Homoserinibacter sp. YIM 151385]
MDDAWLDAVAASPWLLPALFGLVVADALVVVLPSETLVVALGALWGASGEPAIGAVLAVAAAGAVVGDSLCYLLGRTVGLERWRWQRGPRVARAVGRVRDQVHRRATVLVFTARYIPFARIAVNLAAGASRLPYRRYLPLSAAAGCAWAVYNLAIGALFGRVLEHEPLLAVVIAVAVAISLGVVVDAVAQRLARRRAGRER